MKIQHVFENVNFDFAYFQYCIFNIFLISKER